MYWDFSNITQVFSRKNQSKLLLDGKWGLEKESQRITPAGDLALTNHPAVFGDKLTNPHITTDFAESQLELITPPYQRVEDTYESLQAIQAEAERGIGAELLWPLSMPPRLPVEKDIPLARFNDSSEGREKEAYRRGLALRYGKKMQMISGLHYNFSFGEAMLDYLYQQFGRERVTHHEKQEFVNQLYFALARNFLRYRWLLIYLFGASPSVDVTYNSVICQELKVVAACCPEYCSMIENDKQYAASLRVSRFGYSNPVSEFKPGIYHNYFNDLGEYIRNLRRMLSTKSREYGNLGIFQNGIQIQLNDNILQKESEFYAAIRFKQLVKPGETQLDIMEREGVKYLEARILDLNPFEKVGISLQELYFLQVFMLFCLFEPSAPFSETEFEQINKNHHLVALFGRKPGLAIDHYRSGPVMIKNWSWEIFNKLRMVARLIDQSSGGEKYQNSVMQEYQKIIDPSLLPSARIEQEMAKNHESFLEFGLRRAALNKKIQWVGYREVG